jgi:hypothetical protein
MKTRILFLTAIIFVGFSFTNFSCQTPASNAPANARSGSNASPTLATAGNIVRLVVEPGTHWVGSLRFLIFNMKKMPQLAAWVEDESGNYISTILVTNRSGRQNWRAAPREGRPESLPVWTHRIESAPAVTVDTVSSATPRGHVRADINTNLLVSGNTYNVYLEINHSYAYNDTWTEENSGINGQPSLIYHAQFVAGQRETVALVPIGYGSVDGSHGNISYSLENLTTALTIARSVQLYME